MPNYDPALIRVLEKSGGPARLAMYLGVVASAVTQWSRVPARHIPRIEALTGIPGTEIRPDLYSAPEPKIRKLNTAKASQKPKAKRSSAKSRISEPQQEEAA
jgi:DNA-binding transcriptional regulator YdaS (Cro superfamily)